MPAKVWIMQGQKRGSKSISHKKHSYDFTRHQIFWVLHCGWWMYCLLNARLWWIKPVTVTLGNHSGARLRHKNPVLKGGFPDPLPLVEVMKCPLTSVETVRGDLHAHQTPAFPDR